MTKRIRAVLFGPQGSGKGTQGKLLAERFDLPLICLGEFIREEIAESTHLGKLIRSYVESGLLAPDDMVNAVITRGLKKIDSSRGFILDGYPRNVEQATYLDRITKINLAVSIKISDTEAIKRLTGRRQCVKCKQIFHIVYAPTVKQGICSVCGSKVVRRQDDEEEAIKRRLASYHFMTEPLASYYRQRGVLLVVNGEQPIQYVFDDLVRKMSKLGFKI
ncbi:MAG: nucleoside monophosphate kinase [Patescibacteria group bacterium]